MVYITVSEYFFQKEMNICLYHTYKCRTYELSMPLQNSEILLGWFKKLRFIQNKENVISIRYFWLRWLLLIDITTDSTSSGTVSEKFLIEAAEVFRETNGKKFVLRTLLCSKTSIRTAISITYREILNFSLYIFAQSVIIPFVSTASWHISYRLSC